MIKHQCLSCNKIYSKKKNDQELKKRIKNTFKFSNNDINKFILLVRKSVYPDEYVSIWKNEKSLIKHPYLEKKNFMAT